jgi:hypothetical protein
VSVVAGNHRLAIDQERVRLKVSGGFDNGREAISPIIAMREPSRRASSR